jgi:PAS domain S-box-containing protein
MVKPDANTPLSRIRLSQRVMTVATLLMLGGVIYYILGAANPMIFDFTWRWFVVPVSIAILINVVVLLYLLTKTTSRKGSLYWFTGFIVANISYLTLVLLETMSVNGNAAAFWQGLWPASYLIIPMLLLFFVFSYVGDTAMPRNLVLWVVMVVATAVLQMTAISTNLFEYHIPHKQVLLPWGYQNTPGDALTLVFLWMLIVMIVIMIELIRAYRHTINRIAKRQLLIFMIAIGQYLAIAATFDLVIYAIDPVAFPPMSFVHFTLLATLIGYGILKYGLFQLNPTSLASPILENLSEAVIGVNNDLRVEFANRGAAAILNMDIPVLQGKYLSELFRAKEYAVIEQGIQATDTYDLEDTLARSAGGQLVPVNVSIRPALGDRGARAGFIVVMQNVTELKRKSVELAKEKASVERKVVARTKELHEERARLQASIESLSVGFLLVDSKANPVIQNQALQRILDMPAPAKSLEELKAKTGNFDLVGKSKEAQVSHHTSEEKAVVTGSKVLRIFMAPVMLDGDSGSAVLGTVVLIEDITEAKVLERSRDEFFSIASHELRTPLTAIRGNTDMMLDYFGKDLKNPDLLEMLHDVHDSSTNLIAIVNDFLDMSRLEQGKMSFELKSLPIEPIIEKLAYEMKPVLQEKKLEFRFDIKQLDGLPQVLADETRIRQIMYNLVGNSVKFTEKGHIDIATNVLPNDMLEVSVTDTGRGIAVEAQKMLFHKFQQASDSLLTRDTSRGTGLGLYISQLIVRNMGGELKLVKTKEGKGSTFSFTVPLATPKRLAAITKKDDVQVSTKTGLTVDKK